jgi:hypothetical protein
MWTSPHSLQKKEVNPEKSDLPIELVRRITCDASVISVIEDAENPSRVGWGWGWG